MDEQENKEQEFLKDKQNIPNKNVIGVVLIVVVIVGGYFVFKNQTPKSKQEEQKPKTVVIPQFARVSANNLQKELPINFPKEIPLNGKTKVLESYSATYPNLTAKQSTISFQSSKTPKENYDFYDKWAKDNEWKTLNSSQQENLMSLYFQKNQTTLNIVINNKINITYAEI